MRILILTTFYPPDTVIAAVRPYMLAKYLARQGHDVTVMRSGVLNDGASDFFDMEIPVRVISYLGPDSPAERYARGEETFAPVQGNGKGRLAMLPDGLANLIRRLYSPIAFWMEQRKTRDMVQQLKSALDELSHEHFDVVFSTFGRLENIAGGQYAAKLFGCKLIQDFRDALAAAPFCTRGQFRFLQKLQKDAIVNADGITAVSDGLRSELLKNIPKSVPNMTLYNGYEPVARDAIETGTEPDVFNICYTGILYEGCQDFTPLLRALRQLAEEKRIDLSKVRLHYAGPNFQLLQNIAHNMDMEQILVSHGYVSREEAARIQHASDLFLVLSWNRKGSQGILTGKFYEGIRAKKPILSVINGDLPGSELYALNEKFCYGFCYEDCRKDEQFSQLCDYLERAYNEKLRCGSVDYRMNPELEAAFRYDHLAQQLEDFIREI